MDRSRSDESLYSCDQSKGPGKPAGRVTAVLAKDQKIRHPYTTVQTAPRKAWCRQENPAHRASEAAFRAILAKDCLHHAFRGAVWTAV